MVYYSSPFSCDKNIGKAYNDFIKLLPDDAWICITDADAMFMLPNYGVQIEEIIKQHGQDFALIGATTNRLGGLHQCYKNEFSDDMDVRNHYEIAKKLKGDNGTEVKPTKGVAGFFMLFSKETWRKCRGFKEETIKADSMFNRAIKNKGGKIGIATGLYMFHCYRIWEKGHKNAWHSIEHLR